MQCIRGLIIKKVLINKIKEKCLVAKLHISGVVMLSAYVIRLIRAYMRSGLVLVAVAVHVIHFTISAGHFSCKAEP